jgi:hypothetical protein
MTFMYAAWVTGVSPIQKSLEIVTVCGGCSSALQLESSGAQPI